MSNCENNVAIQAAKEFHFHEISADQSQRIKYIRDQATRFLEVINNITAPSREQSLAKTKLEECVMWANKSISLEGVTNG